MAIGKGGGSSRYHVGCSTICERSALSQLRSDAGTGSGGGCLPPIFTCHYVLPYLPACVQQYQQRRHLGCSGELAPQLFSPTSQDVEKQLRQALYIGAYTRTPTCQNHAMAPTGLLTLQQRNAVHVRNAAACHQRPSLHCQAHQRWQDARTATEPSTSGNDAVQHHSSSSASRRALLLAVASVPAAGISAVGMPLPAGANEFLEGSEDSTRNTEHVHEEQRPL